VCYQGSEINEQLQLAWATTVHKVCWQCGATSPFLSRTLHNSICTCMKSAADHLACHESLSAVSSILHGAYYSVP
jgi:hypothetical protein